MLKKTNTERLDRNNCLVINHLQCIRLIMFCNENQNSQNDKKYQYKVVCRAHHRK